MCSLVQIFCCSWNITHLMFKSSIKKRTGWTFLMHTISFLLNLHFLFATHRHPAFLHGWFNHVMLMLIQLSVWCMLALPSRRPASQPIDQCITLIFMSAGRKVALKAYIPLCHNLLVSINSHTKMACTVQNYAHITWEDKSKQWLTVTWSYKRHYQLRWRVQIDSI